MKIKLLNSPVFHYTNDLSYYSPNIALATLSSFLYKHGINVEQDDLNTKFAHWEFTHKLPHINLKPFYDKKLYKKFIFDNLLDSYLEINIRRILNLTTLSQNYNLLGFSVQGESQLVTTLILAKYIKEKYGLKIVLGGPYITLMCTEPNIKERKKILNIFFNQFPFIDWLIYGRGEEPLFSLVDSISKKYNFMNMKNIIGKNIENVEQITDFSNQSSSISYFKGLPIQEYKQLTGGEDFYFYPVTRGCLHKCSFCSARFIDPKPLCRNPTEIIRDLNEIYRKYKINKFIFGADMINLNENNLKSICEKIISENLKIKWVGIATPQKFSYSLLKKMKNSGCIKLCFGTESGSNKVLTDMNKSYRIKDVEKHIKMCYENNIKINLYLIVGFPTETTEDFKATINFILKNKKYITNLTLNLFHLERNSPIYLKPEKFGISKIETRSYFDLPFGFECKFEKDGLSFNQIVENMKQKMRIFEKVLIENNINYTVNEAYGYVSIKNSENFVDFI